MGQAVRMEKYKKVWSYLDDTWEPTRRLIEKLLTMLSDEQLDDLVRDLEVDYE